MLADLKIGSRLGIAVLLPLLVAMALAAYDLTLRWNTAVEMARLGHLTDGVASISNFIHELQRERGASAVFMNSKGTQLRAELPEQRKRTDNQQQAALAGMALMTSTSAAGELKGAIEK